MARSLESSLAASIKEIIERHGRKRENLLPILQDAVKEHFYVGQGVTQIIAKELDISDADVYGTATFYEFIPTTKTGENVIRICKNISCYMEGKDGIIAAIEDFLQIRLGETTHDRKFTFLAANCLGWCHEGPAMLINDKPYTKLTREKAVEALGECM
ncbi:MAG: NADH-quinone oxidoreductase subunit NuoE family protein [Planctomycetota bacterium]|jgi:NADH:ubiquinone oxidoreductase subunit E